MFPGFGNTPPLFLDQLTHLILRSALDRCDDPYLLRAAELLLPPQCVGFHESAALLADARRSSASCPGACWALPRNGSGRPALWPLPSWVQIGSTVSGVSVLFSERER